MLMYVRMDNERKKKKKLKNEGNQWIFVVLVISNPEHGFFDCLL